FSAPARVLREHRQGLQTQDERIARCAQSPRRHRRLDRCRALPAAGHHPVDRLNRSHRYVSSAEQIEVQETAQPQEHRSIRLPRFYYAGLLSVLGGLLLWELVSRVVVANSLFLAAPSQIFGAIVALAGTGELWRHMWISAVEFALGYVIASVAMAESPVMKRVLQPWISGLYATPTIALAPLFILWLGIGIWSKVLV